MGDENIKLEIIADNNAGIVEGREVDNSLPRTFTLRSVATAARLITDVQRENGWNEENLANLGNLYIKAKCYEKAHKKCRDKNERYHTMIQIPMLALSSFLTLFIAVAGGGNISGLVGQTYYFAEFALTVLITFLSILDKYYHNDVNGVKHHNISRQYLTLGEKVKKHIDVRDDIHTYNAVYNKYNSRFIDIRFGSLSIFKKVRKKYDLDLLE